MNHLLTVCLSIALLASCCENEQAVVKPKKVELLISGQLIELEYSIATTSDKDSLSFVLNRVLPTGELRSEYYVEYFSTSPGIQPIGPNGVVTHYSTLLQDGDVVGNFYNLDTDDAIQDYINVLAFSAEEKSATLEIQASYLVDSVFHYDPSSPDTLILGKSVITLAFD